MSSKLGLIFAYVDYEFVLHMKRPIPIIYMGLEISLKQKSQNTFLYLLYEIHVLFNLIYLLKDLISH